MENVNVDNVEELNEAKKKKSSGGELKDLKKLLKKGIVEFYYKKIDGSKRKAKGTLKKSLIPETDKNDDRIDRTSDDCFYYYDIKKEDWRCFRKDNFIKIENKDKEK